MLVAVEESDWQRARTAARNGENKWWRKRLFTPVFYKLALQGKCQASTGADCLAALADRECMDAPPAAPRCSQFLLEAMRLSRSLQKHFQDEIIRCTGSCPKRAHGCFQTSLGWLLPSKAPPCAAPPPTVHASGVRAELLGNGKQTQRLYVNLCSHSPAQAE